MALSIRLRRVGKKKQPFYRIVVQDRRSATDGVVIEEVGTHNPLHEPVLTVMKKERIRFWLDRGAIPTDTVKSLMKAGEAAGA